MRLLLVGAFPYPHAQGSQVYFQEQAIALRAAGAKVELLTYGPGRSPTPDATVRALAGFAHTAIPAWAAPASRRSGPNRGKPIADLCVTAALRRLCRPASYDASSTASIAPDFGASCDDPPASFDAILAHHAEAALAALHGLPEGRPPVVYCAHTLLGEELPTYFGGRLRGHGLASLGRVIDRWIARRAEGWIALTQTSARVMSAASSGSGRLIAPPVAEPSGEHAPLDPAGVASRHGLAPGRFFLYSGNLDAYQDLPLLERVARARARRERPDPIVIATHDERADSLQRGAARTGEPIVLRVRSAAEMRALIAAARATLITRRSPGGFPIKLANSFAAGTPAVVFLGEEWGLESGRDSLVCDPRRPVESLAEALDRLEGDDALAARLRAGARATWSARHAPARAAAETLDLIDEIVGRRRDRRARR